MADVPGNPIQLAHVPGCNSVRRNASYTAQLLFLVIITPKRGGGGGRGTTNLTAFVRGGGALLFKQLRMNLLQRIGRYLMLNNIY